MKVAEQMLLLQNPTPFISFSRCCHHVWFGQCLLSPALLLQLSETMMQKDRDEGRHAVEEAMWVRSLFFNSSTSDGSTNCKWAEENSLLVGAGY